LFKPGGSLEIPVCSSGGDIEVEAPVSNAGGGGVGFSAASAGAGGRGGFFLVVTIAEDKKMEAKNEAKINHFPYPFLDYL